MKQRVLCSVLFVSMLLGTGQAWGWEGVVVKVLDGDSLQVRREGRLVEIRLYGIDTPEHHQAYSNKARQLTRELLYRQTVAVEEKDVDRYGRIVALVTCQGRLVNRELVRAGLAWHYPKYCRSQPLCSELAVLEQGARTTRLGLWADPGPVAPWEWKRRQRSGSAERRGWPRRFLDWWQRG
ncbi:MAG: thermonuclease family protein [Desulfobulbaceae bacterium]